jgi:hypothetical protein
VGLFREPDAVTPPVRFDEREQETELRQTGLRRVTRKRPNSHREAEATAPVLDSTSLPPRPARGGVLSVIAILRQLTVLPCAVALGHRRTSRCDISHRQDLLFRVYWTPTKNPSNPILIEDCKTNLRLPEEQFPPVETQHPQRRMTNFLTVAFVYPTAMDAATRGVMSRKLVWIEQQRFRGFGCSECAWVFNPTSAPNFELQRDKEFTSHICADHPARALGAGTLNNSEHQDWGKLYRAAVLESDRSKLLQRIEQAEVAILERSRSLSKSPGNNRKEQKVITRALHILSLLRKAVQEP